MSKPMKKSRIDSKVKGKPIVKRLKENGKTKKKKSIKRTKKKNSPVIEIEGVGRFNMDFYSKMGAEMLPSFIDIDDDFGFKPQRDDGTFDSFKYPRDRERGHL